jgi:hypothetical protein
MEGDAPLDQSTVLQQKRYETFHDFKHVAIVPALMFHEALVIDVYFV